MSQQVEGHVVQIIGPVVDVEFPDGHLPSIMNAVRIQHDGGEGQAAIDVTAERAARTHSNPDAEGKLAPLQK